MDNKTTWLEMIDFKESKGFEVNGVKCKTKAEFFDINPETEKVFKELTKAFQDLNDVIEKNGIELKTYLLRLGNLNKEVSKYPEIKVDITKKDGFTVRIKGKLKKEFKQVSPSKSLDLYALYAIQWEESERGWGIRPDGYSFHKNVEDAHKFVKDYWKKQNKTEVPYEYSRPANNEPSLVEVSKGLYEYVMKNGSVWLSPNDKKAYKTYDASKLVNKPKM